VSTATGGSTTDLDRPISDNVEVPGNRGLSGIGTTGPGGGLLSIPIIGRSRTYRGRRERGRPTALISMHSFTPRSGVARPWHSACVAP